MAYRNTLLQNNIYVDSIHGNDASAVKYNVLHPYRTVTAAMAVAILGDTIIVNPGSYIENNLYKDGITYYMYPGVNLNCYFGYNNNSGEKCAVYGHADITRFSDVILPGAGELILECNSITQTGLNTVVAAGSANPTSRLDLICNSITSSAHVFRMYPGGSVATVNATVHGDINAVTSFIHTGFGGNTDAIVNIKATRMISSGANQLKLIFGESGTDAVQITANEIIVNGGAGANVYAAAILFQCRTVSTAVVKIDADIVINATNTRAFLSNGSGANAVFEHTGDIYSEDAAITFIQDGTTSLLATYKFNGAISGINSVLGVGYEGVVVTNVNAGDPLNLYLDGSITNRVEVGNGIKQSGSIVPTHIIGDLKIITTVGFAMASDLADTYKVVHSLARVDPNDANFGGAPGANVITGSVDYQDLLVQ